MLNANSEISLKEDSRDVDFTYGNKQHKLMDLLLAIIDVRGVYI